MTRGHLFDSVGHLLEMEGHLFDREGHLFDRKGIYLIGRDIYVENGHNFVTDYKGGRNFEHVYGP